MFIVSPNATSMNLIMFLWLNMFTIFKRIISLKTVAVIPLSSTSIVIFLLSHGSYFHSLFCKEFPMIRYQIYPWCSWKSWQKQISYKIQFLKEILQKKSVQLINDLCSLIVSKRVFPLHQLNIIFNLAGKFCMTCTN